MTRTLLDGTIVEEFDNAVDITVHTRCPSKWKLVDMETGQEYIGTHESPRVNILDGIKSGVIGQKAFIKYGTWIKIKRGES